MRLVLHAPSYSSLRVFRVFLIQRGRMYASFADDDDEVWGDKFHGLMVEQRCNDPGRFVCCPVHCHQFFHFLDDDGMIEGPLYTRSSPKPIPRRRLCVSVSLTRVSPSMRCSSIHSNGTARYLSLSLLFSLFWWLRRGMTFELRPRRQGVPPTFAQAPLCPCT